MADDIILLDLATVAYQGTWSDLRQKPEQITKIGVSYLHPEPRGETLVNHNIQDAGLKVAEATSDLSRATGDLSLYGRCWLPFHFHIHTDTTYSHRLLHQGCWRSQLSATCRLYSRLLILHYVPSILVENLDGSTILSNVVLHWRLSHTISNGLGLY